MDVRAAAARLGTKCMQGPAGKVASHTCRSVCRGMTQLHSHHKPVPRSATAGCRQFLPMHSAAIDPFLLSLTTSVIDVADSRSLQSNLHAGQAGNGDAGWRALDALPLDRPLHLVNTCSPADWLHPFASSHDCRRGASAGAG